MKTIITKAERDIMNVLWEKEYTSNYDITKELEETRNWSRHTIKAYLNRLLDKGVIGVDKISTRRYRYYPLLSKEELFAAETKKCINDHYNSIPQMLSAFINTNEISEKDLDDLENFIESYRKKNSKND